MDLRTVFAGSPAFAVPSLEAMVDAGMRPLRVYSQPDRPAGRGRRQAPTAVKARALELGLDVHTPRGLRREAASLRELAPDVLVVVAYGVLLSPEILGVPRYGALNVHASLLPRWRGAAPIARAIEAGDAMTGVTIMQMDAGLDTGAIVHTESMPLTAEDTAASVHDRLARLGAAALVSVLNRLRSGPVPAVSQDEAGATYARKLAKEEARIDWSEPAAVIARRVRAFNPWPVAHTLFRGAPLRIWLAGEQQGPATGVPGALSVVGQDLVVNTGDGALRLDRVQAAGGRPLSGRDFANGVRLRSGECLV